MSSSRLPEAALADLEGLFGRDNVVESPAERVAGVAPGVEVSVVDAEGIVDVVNVAAGAGLTVCPVGAGTKLGWGAPPRSCDILVRTTSRRPAIRDSVGSGSTEEGSAPVFQGPLVSISEYDPDNLTITVGAGASVAEVKAFAARDGLVLPLDPPDLDTATIGGVLSTNDHGPHRLARGGNRDVTLGLGAVLMNGDRIKVGGRTMKNVTGYDLTRLLVGSFGTLAILTEATLRLLPAPPCEQVVICPRRDLASIAELVGKIRASRLLPAALEVLCPVSSRMVDEMALGVMGSEGHVVVVAFEGQEAAVERQVRDLSTLLEGAGKYVVAAPRPIETLWTALQRLRRAGRDMGYSLQAKVSVPPTRLWETLAPLEADAAVDVMWTASPATGTAHVAVGSLETVAAVPADLVSPLIEARAVAERVGGSVVLMDGSHMVVGQIDAWGAAPGGLPVMMALKSRFDPRGGLNPGRFVGGI